MLKLFTTGTTRGLPPCILLEESGVKYDLEIVDIRKKDRPEDLLSFNPLGRMPALIDADMAVDQSVVILIYLADKFKLFLPQANPERSEVLRWLMFAAMDIMFEHSTIFRLLRLKDENVETLLHLSRQRLLGDIHHCNKRLENREYLTGDVSIADLVLYSIVSQYDSEALRRFGFSALQDWIGRLKSRQSVISAERNCPYLYDVSTTLGTEPYEPEVAVEGLRPVA